MENKVVVHLRDGRVFKGITRDFDPGREQFHLLPAEGGGVPLRLPLGDMKALFYVKDFVGNADFQARQEWQRISQRGRRTMVTFEDGEVIWGTCEDYEPSARGFFLVPVDPDDNNRKIFVVSRSVRQVEFVDA